MESFFAEPWYWIAGITFFVFVVVPICTVMGVFKILTWVRNWWNSEK